MFGISCMRSSIMMSRASDFSLDGDHKAYDVKCCSVFCCCDKESFIWCFLQLDDWVLCRIYQKSSINALPPTTATASDDQDQDAEEQFIQDAILTSFKSPLGLKTHIPREYSFSNLIDAVDYSIPSSSLSDNLCNGTGFQSTFSCASIDQPFFSNFTTTSSSSSSLFQRLPPLNSIAAIANVENQLKRQHSNLDEDTLYPSKKIVNSCSFTDSPNQSDIPYHNMLNQSSWFSQHLLLSPHLQFQNWIQS